MKNRQCKNDILLLWLPMLFQKNQSTKFLCERILFPLFSAWKYGVKSRFSFFHTCVNRLGKFFAPVLFLSPVTLEEKLLSLRLPHIIASDAGQFRVIQRFVMTSFFIGKMAFSTQVSLAGFLPLVILIYFKCINFLNCFSFPGNL